jgi:hypothetical protein
MYRGKAATFGNGYPLRGADGQQAMEAIDEIAGSFGAKRGRKSA